MARAAAVIATMMATAMMATAAPKAADHWLTSWATAQQIVEPKNMLAPEEMRDATLRQVVRLSLGGRAVRLVLSNAFGTAPLHLQAVHLARARGADRIDPASDKTVASDLTIPAGATWVSDAIALPVAAFADLAISIHYDTAPAVETGHPGSRQTSYLIAGDHLGDETLAGAKPVEHWYQIAAIEVATTAKGAVAVLGDSITDGRGSTTNGNDRWTNVLAERLKTEAVLNAGLGGNCLLSQCLGPNAISRIERDVLAPAGVTAVIVLEGINDLGGLTVTAPVPAEDHNRLVQNLIAGYRQIALRAHGRGLKAYVGTILPYMGAANYHPDAANEADRNAINAWIRRQREFDGVIDFDAAMRDPLATDRLNPVYDSGDHLHPSPAGYRVMGEVAAKALRRAKGKK